MSQSAKKYTDGITRRAFLASAVALVPGCDVNTSAPPETQTKRNPNIYTVLAGFQLTGKDGKKIDINDLRDQNRGKYVTVTFSFNGCKQFCPFINKRLTEIDGAAPSPSTGKKGETPSNLVHYVINVNPGIDNLSQKDRNDFSESFYRLGLPRTIPLETLYPKDETIPAKIAIKMGLTVNPNLREEGDIVHSDQIVLYAPDGEYIGRKTGVRAETDFSQWNTMISKGRQNAPAR